MDEPEIFKLVMESQLGFIEISGTDKAILSVSLLDKNPYSFTPDTSAPLLDCKKQLLEYFSGSRKIFDLPLAQSGTEFQQKVWSELCNIPFGQTISYHELSLRLGDAKAIRAAGTANGKNKIAIIVPCHRVIGMNGSLTGYAGGLHRKEWLLRHEGSWPVGNQLEMF